MSTIIISRLGYSLVADADPSPQQPTAEAGHSAKLYGKDLSKPIRIADGLSPARGRALPPQGVYWGTWSLGMACAAGLLVWHGHGHAHGIGGVGGNGIASTPWLGFLLLALGAGLACWYAIRFPGDPHHDIHASGSVLTAIVALLGAAGTIDTASDPTAGMPLFSICMALGSSLWVLGDLMPQGLAKPVVKALWPASALLGLVLLALRWG